MPEIRYYTVRQVREVKVWANSPIGAGEIASAAFDDSIEVQDPVVAEHIISKVREIDLLIREDRT